MLLVNILIDNSKIIDYFISPLLNTKKRLEALGYKIRFVKDLSERNTACDILMLLSKPFFNIVNETESILSELSNSYKTIHSIKKNTNKLIWVDTSDSTSVTHFELMPYIDLYLKKQLFVNRDNYRKDFKGGRIFTDYYCRTFGIKDSLPDVTYVKLKKEHENKLGSAWNIGLGDMNNAFGYRRFLYKVMPGKFKTNYKVKNVINPNEEKSYDIFLKTTANLSRESVAYHRIELIKEIDRIISKNNLAGFTQGKYLKEKEFKKVLASTKLMPSPFGWGEIGVRDFEAFIYGAVLLKPNISYMETYPNYFIENVTYIPFSWDFSDLEEKILLLLENKNSRYEIAESGQNIYNQSVSKNGMNDFVNFFIKSITYG